LHFTLKSDSEIVQHVPKDYNAFGYVVNGLVTLEKMSSLPRENTDGDICKRWRRGISIRAASNTASPLGVLLLAGMPLKEPIAQFGPF
jgi:quercetin 2,3-dioxygenase